MSEAERRKIMLGELLLRAGVVTEAQLRTALAEQKKWGGKLGSILVDLNFLEEDTLVKALSKQLGLPRVDFRGLVVQPEALKLLEAEFADQRQVLPISHDAARKHLVVAMSDPGDLAVVDEIGFRTGCRVKVAIAGEKALARAIRSHYYSEYVPDRVVPTDDGASMKLLSPLGNTMVRKLADAEKHKDAPTAPGQVVAAAETLEDKLRRIESMQRQQVRVLKAMVELLIDKGYIKREEYAEKVGP